MKVLITISFLLVGIQHALAATCTKEKGFCVKENNRDQNSGVIKLDNLNTKSDKELEACLKKCETRIGATGCEAIWDQGNRGCYAHMEYVEKGNNANRHVCWVFSKCTGGSVTPNTTEEIYGAPVLDASDPNVRVFTEAILGYSINRQFGTAKTCKGGIIGFRVKLNKINDADTRINGIEMECQDGSKHVQESEHKKGEWQTGEAKCEAGTHVTGIKWREWRHRGGRQLLVECSDGKVEGPVGYDDGMWTSLLFSGCPTTAKMCGFQGEVGYNEIGRYKVLCCARDQLQASEGDLIAMGKDVCIGGKNDNFGFFKAPKAGFLTELHLRYRDGYLTCNNRKAIYTSRFGCNSNPNVQRSFSIFATKTDKRVIVPDIMSHPVPGNSDRWYYVIGRSGLDADNFTMNSVNPTYVNKNDEIRLWYGEDLHNRHESDNGDTVVCVNVFGKMM